MQTKASGWCPALVTARSSNDNARAEVDPAPGSLPAKSGVTRLAIAGVIEEGLIASLLQMWANSASTGKLEVVAGIEQGAIELRKGSIVHAWLGVSLGQAACYRILSLEHGEFKYRADHRDEEPPTPEDHATARQEIHELLFAWVRL